MSERRALLMAFCLLITSIAGMLNSFTVRDIKQRLIVLEAAQSTQP